MASLLLRSAGQVLGRSIPEASFPRCPGRQRLLSDGVGRFQCKHCCSRSKLTQDPCHMTPHSYFLELQKQSRIASENSERFERRKILYACFFGPIIFYLGMDIDKKKKL